jgi:hypothetical protein
MVEPTQEWIFTFGAIHENHGKCVRIKGTYDSARSKMFELYGDRRAFQYSSEAWQQMIDDKSRYWPMEEEIAYYVAE